MRFGAIKVRCLARPRKHPRHVMSFASLELYVALYTGRQLASDTIGG